MVKATAGSERVVMYSSFEKTHILALQRAVPALAPADPGHLARSADVLELVGQA